MSATTIERPGRWVNRDTMRATDTARICAEFLDRWAPPRLRNEDFATFAKGCPSAHRLEAQALAEEMATKWLAFADALRS